MNPEESADSKSSVSESWWD